MSKKPIIISTDPGIDDIAALTISLFAPELAVKLIVPTWGNVALTYTLQNTLNLQQFLGTAVPVVAGAKAPLVAPQINAANVHGPTGLAGFHFKKADHHLQCSGLAATAMYQQIMKSSQKVTLIGIGPLTDFALLLQQYPEAAKKIEQIVIMGGSLGRGNHGPLTEYNIAGDPEAAHIVFASRLPLKMAPLEIGNQTRLTTDTMQYLKSSGPVGQMLFALFKHLQRTDERGQIRVYDPTAVALVLAPQLFTMQPARAAIELRGQYTYGASVIDFAAPYNASVAVKVQTAAFADWFKQAVAKAEQGRTR